MFSRRIYSPEGPNTQGVERLAYGVKYIYILLYKGTSPVLLIALVLFLGLGVFSAVFAAFNTQINYQGKLTNASSVAVADGNNCMKFRIMSAASAGTEYWSEEWDAATSYVSTTSGMFSVLLGANNTALSTMDFNLTALWLEVQYDPGCDDNYEEIFTPRKRLGAVPAAFEADKIDGIDSGSFLRSDADDTATGQITLTDTPDGSAVGQGALYINPTAATADYTLLGLAVNGTQKFRLDADGDLAMSGNLTVGGGTAATDYTLTFNGETNDGLLTWMEDEDYFQFSDDILLLDNERMRFGTGADTSIYYDGTNMIINPRDGGSGNLGIRTTGPDAQFDVLATTEQLRLTYTDGSVYSSFTVNSGGDLTIAATGGDISFGDENLTTSGTLELTNGSNYLALRHDGAKGIITTNAGGGELELLGQGNDVYFFDGNALGENYEIRVYGYITATSGASFAALNLDDTNDEFMIDVNDGSAATVLDVAVQLDDTAGSSVFRIRDSGGTEVFYVNSDGNLTMIDDAWIGLGSSAGRIAFDNQNIDQIELMSGHVGIGTASPETTLDILSTTGAQLYLTNVDNSKYASFQVDSNGDLTITPTGGDTILGNGAAGVDYTLQVNGETNDGLLTWMEDEDYFQFSDDILLPDNEKLKFGTGVDSAIYYDGTDLILQPNDVGTGFVRIGTSDNDKLTFGQTRDALMYYDGSDLVVRPDYVGDGGMKILLGTQSDTGLYIDQTTTDYTGTANNYGIYNKRDVSTAADTGNLSSYSIYNELNNSHIVSGSPAYPAINNYGTYNNLSVTGAHSATPAVGFDETNYGAYNYISRTGTLTLSSAVISSYGSYNSANDAFSYNKNGSTITSNNFGGYFNITQAGTLTTGDWTKTNYGVYSTVSGSTTGTTVNYGVYSTVSGADTNYSGWFDGGHFVIDDDGAAGAGKLYFGEGQDATIYYDGTNMIINPRDGGSGNLGIRTTGPDAQFDVLATTEQLRLTYTDGSVYSSFTTDSAGDLTITPSGGDTILGNGAAGVDYTLQVNGETNDGVLTWMEDEDYFQFSDDIMLPDNEAAKFGTGADASIYYDASDLVVRPDVVGTGGLKLLLGASADTGLYIDQTTTDYQETQTGYGILLKQDVSTPASSTKVDVYGISSNITNSHAINGTSTASILNYASYNSVASSAAHSAVFGSGSLNEDNYGSYNSILRSGTLTSSATSIDNYGIYGYAADAVTYNKGGSTLTTNNYGGYFYVLESETLTSGDLTKTNYGVYSLVSGSTSGTSVNYGVFSSVSGADTNYSGWFNGGHMVLDDDGAAGTGRMYFGEGQDAYVEFDSNSMNLVANVVTTTDDMEFTAESYTFKTNADTDLAVNFSGTTTSGVLTWMEDEDYFRFSDDVQLLDNEKLILGTGSDGNIFASPDDNIFFANTTQDKDIFFQVNDGGSTTFPLFIDGSSSYVGVGTTGPGAVLNIYEPDENTDLTAFTRSVNNAGVLITTNYTASAYTPGLFWNTSDNNDTRPKAGIWLLEDGSGTDMYFGTSNDYSAGITNNGLILDQVGNIGIGTTGPNRVLEVNSANGTNLRLTYNDSNGSATNYTDFFVSSGGDLNIIPSGGDITLGTGDAGVDHILTIDGETNDGVLTWMEDEDYFQFSDDILLPDNEKIKFGTGVDSAIYYDGTNLVIDPRVIGAGDLIASGDFTIGSGQAGVDYQLTFDGETNDGLLTWMEDENYFLYSDMVNILTTTTPQLQIGYSASKYITLSHDGTTAQIATDTEGDIYFFDGNTIGENYEIRIYGYITATSSATFGAINLDDTNDELLIDVSDGSSGTTLGTAVRLDDAGGVSEFRVRDSGSVEVFSVNSDGNVTAVGTGDFGYLKVTNLDAATATHVCRNANNILSTCSADISEYAPVAGATWDIGAGDVVVVSKTQKNPIDDPEAPFLLERATIPYQQNLVGVIADIVAGASIGEKKDETYKPLVLVGRVPVKVNIENGAIEPGDWLTSSSAPGVAMKATAKGSVIGKALEGYEAEGTGNIMVFVNLGWFGGADSVQLGPDGLILTPMPEVATAEDGVNPELIPIPTSAPEPSPEDASFFQKVKNAFVSFGAAIENGIVWVKELFAEKITTRVVRTQMMEVIDQRTGDVYCTWIEYGEWVKVRGECSTIDLGNGAPLPFPSPSPAPQPEPSSLPEITPEVSPSPEASPEATPETSPETSPEISPSVSPTPEAIPEPSATPEINPSPEPSPLPIPTPEPSPEPSSSPIPTPEPSPSPEPSPEPSPTPEATPAE